MNAQFASSHPHALARAMAVLGRLQQVHDRWEMRSAAVFLLIAWRGEIEKPEMERLFSMSPASGYRNIQLMEDALLVETEKIGGVTVVRLAERGRALAGEIGALMGS